MPDLLSFGPWLKQRRKVLDITQDDLAHAATCSVATVRKLESEDLLPSKQLAQQLALALRVPAAEHEAFVTFARAERETAVVGAFGAATQPQPDPWQPAPPAQPAPPPDDYRLPAQLTSLIGREWEVQALCVLLRRPSARLVTLTGAPGAGKTRLGLAIAEILGREFLHDVCFIALAPISDATLVLPAIAHALGIHPSANQPVLLGLQTFLEKKQLLLVLDNFEQVVSAAAELSALLASAAGLKVLVTSRTVLRVYGEHEFPVPPLTLPDLQRLPTFADLMLYPAVELFVQRAQAVQPTFAITPANAQIIAEICTALEGLPLAIELAAARVKWQPPQTLLNQLSQRLSVLTGGPRNLAPRQQTLRAAIDWSYNLLEPAEKTLFRSLAIFVGGCTTAAVFGVMGADSEGTTEMALHSLVDQSLLQCQSNEQGEDRYVMLEMLREYALEQLTLSGELAATQQQHAAYFSQLAHDAAPHIQFGEQQIGWFNHIAAEHSNIRAALHWALHGGAPAIAMQLVVDLDDYWDYRGDYHEVRQWAERAMAQSVTPTALSAQMLTRAGRFAWRQGDFAGSQQFYEQALAIQQGLGDRAGVGDTLRGLGVVARERIQYTQAAELLNASLTIERELGDIAGVIQVLLSQANLARQQGDYDLAERCTLETYPLLNQIGDTVGRRYTLTGLGRVALRRHQFSQAARLFRDSLQISVQLKDRRAIAAVLECLAAAIAGLGNSTLATNLFGKAQSLREETGSPNHIDGQIEYERDVALAQAQLDETQFATAWAAGRRLALEQVVALALAE
ncbi:MAG: tetratricopeptide repeat protein [Chloroflexota bacterium]|nr:tetratricopeptide repeat protein [Chloroflexota bacterium]